MSVTKLLIIIVIIGAGVWVAKSMGVFEKRSSLAANLSQRSYATSVVFIVMRRLVKWLIHQVPWKADPVEMAGSLGRDKSRPDRRFDAISVPLTKIGQRLRRAGVPFLLVYQNHVSDELVEVIRAVGDREGFAVRSLNPWGDSRWQDDDPSEYRNSEVDAHWSPKGCRVNALLIHELMVGTGLLD